VVDASVLPAKERGVVRERVPGAPPRVDERLQLADALDRQPVDASVQSRESLRRKRVRGAALYRWRE
jgi:hypothetical protein